MFAFSMEGLEKRVYKIVQLTKHMIGLYLARMLQLLQNSACHYGFGSVVKISFRFCPRNFKYFLFRQTTSSILKNRRTMWVSLVMAHIQAIKCLVRCTNYIVTDWATFVPLRRRTKKTDSLLNVKYTIPREFNRLKHLEDGFGRCINICDSSANRKYRSIPW